MAHIPDRQLALISPSPSPSPALQTVPERVHLLPAGEVWGFDGRGPYRLLDASGVIAASQPLIDSGQARIDYGHAAWLGADQGAGAENAGFITALEYIPENQVGGRTPGLWAAVRWTETARRKLAERAYTALSPVFEHDAEGRILRLLGGGLTNKPNLPLTALAARSDGGGGAAPATPLPMPEDGLDTTAPARATLAEKLAKIFRLPDAASEDALVTYAAQLMDAFARADDSLAAIRKVLALPAEAAPARVATAVQSRTAEANTLSVTLATLQDQVNGLRQHQVTAEVDGLIAAGRAFPNERDTLIAMATRMPEHYRRVVADRPTGVMPLGERRLGGRPPTAGPTHGLDEGRRTLCSRLGISPDAFVKTLAAETLR